MSSTRTYRRALSLDNVLGEIRRCAGKQFDPNLAEMFLTLDFQPFVQMLQQCQAASENAPDVGPNSLDAQP
jgi:response regulator RpfG family c-di-GMP phosphodiesterase